MSRTYEFSKATSSGGKGGSLVLDCRDMIVFCLLGIQIKMQGEWAETLRDSMVFFFWLFFKLFRLELENFSGLG